MTGGNGDDYGVAGLFLRLLKLSDAAMLGLIPIVMGETLMAGTAAVEAVGTTLGIQMADWWEADTAFFDLIRDREVLTRIVAEVAGDRVAEANGAEKAKTLKTIIRAHLDGEDGRQKVERWVPRWMRFAPSAYTERGGVGTVRAASKVEAAQATVDDQQRSAAILALPAPVGEAEEQLAA